jgi:hypothetical protein
VPTTKVETDADAVLDSSDKLRVRWHRNGCEVSGARFAVHRQHSPKRKLKPAAVAPRPNCVRETDWLRATLHSDPGE